MGPYRFDTDPFEFLCTISRDFFYQIATRSSGAIHIPSPSVIPKVV